MLNYEVDSKAQETNVNLERKVQRIESVSDNSFKKMTPAQASPFNLYRMTPFGPMFQLADNNDFSELDKDNQKRVKENKEKIEDFTGKYRDSIGEIVAKIELSGKFSKSALSRIKTSLEKLEAQTYEGKKIVDSDKTLFGGINYEITKIIDEKVLNQKDLTRLEQEIYMCKDLISGGSGYGVYPEKYSKADWDDQTPSPFVRDFYFFLEAFKAFAIQRGIVSSLDELHDILGLTFGHTLDERLRGLQGVTTDGKRLTKSYYKVDEEILDRWFVRIRNFIEENFGNKKDTLIGELNHIFDFIYRRFGYEAFHPLYREVRLMLAELGDILLDAGSISSNSIRGISTLMGTSSSNLHIMYRYLRKNPIALPTTTPSETILDLVLKNAPLVDGAEFTPQHEILVKDIISSYIQKIVDFRAGRDLLKSYKRDTYRKTLLVSIIDKCEALQKLPNVDRLSQFLFGKKDGIYSFLSEELNWGVRRDTTKPYLNVIFKILYYSSKWTVEDFKNEHIFISRDTLSKMKSDISYEVFKWVENDEYDIHYLGTKELQKVRAVRKLKGPSNLWPEYELVKTLWLAAVAHEENIELSFGDMENLKIFKESSLVANLREGAPFKKSIIMDMILTLKQWVVEEGKKLNRDSEKISYYLNALSKLGGYKAIRNLRLKPRTQFSVDRETFFKDYAAAYHVILGLGRHLGFDPGFFRPIEDKSFHLTKEEASRLKLLGKKVIRFMRHHFRDDPFKSSSLLLEDQILVDGRSHNFLEVLSEDEILVMTGVLERLIRRNDKIEKTDIENEFRKYGDNYLWLMENWFNQLNFEKNLDVFNDRKEKIKSMPLDQFIQEVYPIAYHRFYENILKNKKAQVCSLIQRFHSSLDISTLLNVGKSDPYIQEFIRTFTKILRDYNYPTFF